MVHVHVGLGDWVTAGQAIVTLDVSVLAEARGALEAAREHVEAEVSGLDEQMKQAAGALLLLRETAVAAGERNVARLKEIDATLRLAEERYSRLTRLPGVEAEVHVSEARTEAERLAHQRWAERQAAREASGEYALSMNELERQLSLLRQRRNQAAARRKATLAEVRRLDAEMERYEICAPVDGHMGDLVQLRSGAFLEAGDRIGSVLPPGEIKVSARFRSRDALGKIELRDRARVFVEAFPWARHGSLNAIVTRVGRETRDGVVQVECCVPAQQSSIPIRHGLDVVVEIAIEDSTAAEILLHALGQASSYSVQSAPTTQESP